MDNVVFFSLLSLVYCIMTSTLFFKKDRIKGLETRVYGIILAMNLFGLVLEILSNFAARKIIPVPDFVIEFMLKCLNIYLVSWVAAFAYYMILVSIKNKSIIPKIRKAIYLFDTFGGVLIMFTPITYIQNASSVYSSGVSVNITYLFSSVYIFLCIFLTLKNIKIIFQKKYYPILLFLALGMIIVPLQFMVPELTLMLPLHTFVTCVMYHTIENPDVKMLNELYRNRELMEQGYEDKYNFLFEMTQDAKKPLLDLNKVCNELRLEEDPKKIKDGLMIINNITRQLDFSVNNVLNVSSFDVQKIKLVDTKYDVLKVCEGLEASIKGEVKENVSFNMELPKSAPILYGDYMKLRQILYSLLTNACKNTDDGSINLRLNLIEKYDFCRLIFNISDTGKGMSIEKINDILSATGELDKNELEILEKKEFNFKVCQKVVKIMGGNLMIKSTVGKGTDLTLTLDQRVYHEDENSILNQYENAISTKKRVLLIAQNKDLVTYIKRKLNSNNIDYSSLAFGGDAVDRLKAGKEFDYIIVEDEMKEMSGMATLQEFKKLKGFNTPVIIVLGNSKDNIKHHYLEDGFTDYILADKLEDELIRIINKY